MAKQRSGPHGAAEKDTKTPSKPEGIDEIDTLDEVKAEKAVEDPAKPDEDDGLAKGAEPKGKDLERLEERESKIKAEHGKPEPVNHPATGNYDPRDNAKNANPTDVDHRGNRNPR